MRLRGLSLGIVGTLPIFKGRNSRKNETQPAHTDASIQRNKWTSSQTGSKSKNSFLSPQGTPSSLNCKTNLLISEKKPQTQRKCNSFLSPTGYPTQTENKPAYSREKACKGKKIRFLAVHTRVTPYCRPADAGTAVVLGNLKQQVPGQDEVLRTSSRVSCYDHCRKPPAWLR